MKPLRCLLDTDTVIYFFKGRGNVASRLLQTSLALVSVVPFDEAAAERAAEIRKYLESSGMLIGLLDTLIAGVALARELILVTHNTAEFERIPNLQLEDWFIG